MEAPYALFPDMTRSLKSLLPSSHFKNIQKYRTVRSLKGGKLTQNVVGDANDQAAKNASELREELRTRRSSKWGGKKQKLFRF